MLYADRSSDCELIDLMMSSDWPQAVDPDLICHEDLHSEQIIRAEGILEFFVDEDLCSKKFLDFGCGNAIVADHALEKNVRLSVAYDINSIKRLDVKCLFTTDWNCVRESAPFDVVLIYDVLDHSREDPVNLLLKIREVIGKSSKVYVRLHPWISRHGSHIYHDLNKAFAHLILPERILKKFGAKEIFTRKLTYPLKEYRSWFKKAGFEISYDNVIDENFEDFFLRFEKTLKNYWPDDSLPISQLKVCFADYILKLL